MSVPRKTKRFGDSVPGGIETTRPEGEKEAKIPYTKGEVLIDVKIVEIQPDKDRSIGFVYAKREPISTAVEYEKMEKGGRVIGLKPIWEEYVHWMTPSDFDNFLTDRGKMIPPVKEG
jgi:hypothetical protein